MQLIIDPSVTAPYASDWALMLTITPSTDSARLDWSPSGYEEDETFGFRLGRIPLTERMLDEIRGIFDGFERMDHILATRWEYFHEQGCWRWADGPWWDAAAEFEMRLTQALNA
ncbi:hypothetical protein [Streptomyces sp. NPDC053720]|uniref:hypothetical protein n=1 Tax=Streptomyces sp. NPDC053720 TaxID=3154855 RepID=UPI00341E7CB7